LGLKGIVWDKVSWLMIPSCVFSIKKAWESLGIAALRCSGTIVCAMVKSFIATLLFYGLQLEEGYIPKTKLLLLDFFRR
jgi:hypothetical protein